MTNKNMVRVRADQLSPESFLSEFVAQNRPVIVTGEMESWDIGNNWTPGALERQVGGKAAQVYNNYFDLQNLMPLREYFASYFGKAREPITYEMPLPYVRWYTQLRDVKFFWADDAFDTLKANWRNPSFLPDNDYLLPYAPGSLRADPVVDHFPARGLFISPAGAKTSLHVDPWGSCAVLCQLYGHKRWYFYAPDQAEHLTNGTAMVDIAKPDRTMFPTFDKAVMSYECTLAPGEIMYVPHGWFHQVHSESDSISLTWNFVHHTTQAALRTWLAQENLTDFDQSVLRFFYSIDKTQNVRDGVSAALESAGG
jgi:Cupin-like domain